MAYQFYSWFLESFYSHMQANIVTNIKGPIRTVIRCIFGLLSSLSYATYSWIMKNLIHKGIDSRAAMGVIFGISAVLLLPTLLITATHLFNYQIIFG